MKLSPFALTIAAALAFAAIWTLCSAVVMLVPGLADAAFAGMMHADMPTMHVTLDGFLIGLAGWTLTGAVTALVLAFVYNMAAGARNPT